MRRRAWSASLCRAGPATAREEMQVGKPVLRREVMGGAAGAGRGGRQQPTAWIRVPRRSDTTQPAGREQVQPDGDENDCHRRSVAQKAGCHNRRRFSTRGMSMFESLTQRLSGTIDRLSGAAAHRGEHPRSHARGASRCRGCRALPVVVALIERIKVRGRAGSAEVADARAGADRSGARRTGPRSWARR